MPLSLTIKVLTMLTMLTMDVRLPYWSSITIDILWSLERKKVLAFCAMDLSAAFDTVNHDLLLTMLRARFGLADSAIQWVER